MIEFFKTHYMWIFSGIGVFVISLFFINKGSKKVKNSIKNGSENNQSGRDTIIHKSDKKEDE